MRINLKSKKIAAATVAAVVLSGGAAFAYWSAQGEGQGEVNSAQDSQPVTVNQTPSVQALEPGKEIALAGTFTHANTSPVYVGDLTATITGVTGGSGDCVALDNYELVDATAAIDDEVVTGAAWSGITLKMKNLVTNQDDCKGATVEVDYALSAS